ncbi:hypothetical protein V7S43_002306 [Phytophthora oleae]|uniref:Helicase-associated domain-containing protein n=1 Tax=Phytophthora oleae TaxID=2107226 RepID=A0ABD3G786_9STRA
MDFPYDHTQYKWDYFMKPALKLYFELNGHQTSLSTFALSMETRSGQRSCGGFLSESESTTCADETEERYTTQIKEDAVELAEINCCYDSNLAEEQRYRERILLPLQIYLQKFGNLDVPKSFTVPDCPPWPKLAAGSKLGSTIMNIRNRGDYAECIARDPEFKKLGFDWDPFSTELNERIFPASEIYKLENGHCKVPPNFVVPSTISWPEKLHGYNFGSPSSLRQFRLRCSKCRSTNVGRSPHERYHEKVGRACGANAHYIPRAEWPPECSD